MTAEAFFQFFEHRFYQLSGFFFIRGSGSHTQMDFACFGVSGNRWIFLCLDQIENLCLYQALSHTAQFHHDGINSFRLQSVQIRKNILMKHRDQLIWRTWEQDHGLSIFFHDNAGCGSVVVVDDDASFRNQSLFPVVVCDNFKRTVFKIFFDAFFAVCIFYQWKPHHSSSRLFGQIVLCRTKSAAEDHDIRTVKCRPDRFF